MRRLARESDLELTWIAQESAHPAIAALLGFEAHRVRLKGWLDAEALRDLLDRSGFFLQPSYFEGFSLAFVQAMARGCIVLGSKIDCMNQTIRNGETGLLFPLGMSEPIVNTILQLANDPAGCAAISRAARAVAETMTWQKTALDFAEFCRKLEASKSTTPRLE